MDITPANKEYKYDNNTIKHKKSRTVIESLRHPSALTIENLSSSPSIHSNAFITARKNIIT